MNYYSGWFKNFRIKNKQILIIALAKVVPASRGRIWHPLRQFLQQNKGMRGQRRGRERMEGREQKEKRKIHTYIHSCRHTHKCDVHPEEEKSEALVVWRAPQAPHRSLWHSSKIEAQQARKCRCCQARRKKGRYPMLAEAGFPTVWEKKVITNEQGHYRKVTGHDEPPELWITTKFTTFSLHWRFYH